MCRGEHFHPYFKNDFSFSSVSCLGDLDSVQKAGVIGSVGDMAVEEFDVTGTSFIAQWWLALA